MTVMAALDDVVLIGNAHDDKVVPIGIGDSEALSIRLRLSKQKFPRPLTHDLMDNMLQRFGDQVESVRVERLEHNTFIATVVIDDHGKRVDFDARASDAIALALGIHAPIFVATAVVLRAGHTMEQLHPRDQQPDASPDAGASRDAISL